MTVISSVRNGPWTAFRFFVVFAILLAGVGAVVITNAAQSLVSAQHARENGEVVTARVSSVHESVTGQRRGPDSHTFTPIVLFTTADGKTESAQLLSQQDRPEFQKGDEVEIIYDRTNPQNVVRTSDDALTTIYLALVGGILAGRAGVAFAAGAVWSGVRARRNQ